MRWSFTVSYPDGRESVVIVEGSRSLARFVASSIRSEYDDVRTSEVRSDSLSYS